MILRIILKKEVKVMTYKYDVSLEFRTSFDTSVYTRLSASVTNFSPIEESAIIDSSYVETMIADNARSEMSLENAIIEGIEDTYFADIMKHEEFEPFIVKAASDQGFNVTASVKSYSAEQNNHEVYYKIDLDLICEDDIEYEEIQDFLEKAFDAFLVQFNYDCNTALEPNIDSEVNDVAYDTYDGDIEYTNVEFNADLTIEFDPYEAYNSTTCCQCAISTDEI